MLFSHMAIKGLFLRLFLTLLALLSGWSAADRAVAAPAQAAALGAMVVLTEVKGSAEVMEDRHHPPENQKDRRLSDAPLAARADALPPTPGLLPRIDCALE